MHFWLVVMMVVQVCAYLSTCATAELTLTDTGMRRQTMRRGKIPRSYAVTWNIEDKHWMCEVRFASKGLEICFLSKTFEPDQVLYLTMSLWCIFHMIHLSLVEQEPIKPIFDTD